MFNKNNIKKIIFKAHEEHAQIVTPMPRPMTSVIPEWYKKQKNFSNGENNPIKAMGRISSEGTYKLCVPLIDTLTSGYVFTLPASILVQNSATDGTYAPHVTWQVGWKVLDSMQPKTHSGYPTPAGFSSFIFRWYTDFKIKTPAGYSCWITHPSHRWDLPFLTINGFVDTDKHPNSLLLPFFIKEGFEGIIEEGTPIAQIIPFKRDNWKSEKEELSHEVFFIKQNAAKIDYVRTYKKRYWTRKKYE
jgi:hypothetical protein